ncbi:hypothetical protein [Priestia megaterium]|nr:hypothetical protein [Priestia megaterium]
MRPSCRLGSAAPGSIGLDVAIASHRSSTVIVGNRTLLAAENRAS